MFTVALMSSIAVPPVYTGRPQPPVFPKSVPALPGTYVILHVETRQAYVGWTHNLAIHFAHLKVQYEGARAGELDAQSTKFRGLPVFGDGTHVFIDRPGQDPGAMRRKLEGRHVKIVNRVTRQRRTKTELAACGVQAPES